MKTRKLVKKDCGEHWGVKLGPCSKCKYIGKHRQEHPECYQYGGTPWIAVLGEVVEA